MSQTGGTVGTLRMGICRLRWSCILLSGISWLTGALLTASFEHRQKLPFYVVDFPAAPPGGAAAVETVWVQPRASAPTVIPSLCSFEEKHAELRAVELPYSLSATGSLHLLNTLGQAHHERIVLLIGTLLPSCDLVAQISSLGGTDGLLFRCLLKLSGGQLLRLTPGAPQAEPERERLAATRF